MPRVVIAGLGDSGVLTAIGLARRGLEVVGISSQPGLVSGQELGTRLARPEEWAREYRLGFDRFRALDGVRTVHAELTGLDPVGREVGWVDGDGRAGSVTYDVLVIATGCRNGFWRTPRLRTEDEVGADLARRHEQLAAAGSITVVGGGAAAVSSALQLALRWPDTRITLAFPRERALVQHHPRTWSGARDRLVGAGVELLPDHRAVVPEGFDAEEITAGPVHWLTGQPPTHADAVLWAVGRVRPNTAWLPADLLDEHGFVRVGPTLQLPGRPEMFAIGDVAASDPLRSTARNRADKLLARNIRAHLGGRTLRTYSAPRRRWGSVLGVEPDGLRVFAPTGQAFRFPAWSIETVLRPWIVHRGIYRGIRR